MTAKQELARKLLQTLPMLAGSVNSCLRDSHEYLSPTHFHVLRAAQRGSINLSQLSSRHGVSLPTMSNTIDILVKRGWVQRVRSEQDRRVIEIEITNNGQQMMEKIRDAAISFLGNSLEKLSKEDLLKLSEGLDVLHKLAADMHTCEHHTK